MIDSRFRSVSVRSAQAAWRGVVGMRQNDDLTHAAAIAYYALLSLFPFLLLAFSLLGAVTADASDRSAALTFVLRYFPARFEFVTRQLDAFRESSVQIGVAGGLALLWAALGVFSAVSTAVNHAWRVERKRAFLQHKLVAFLMLLAAGLLLSLTIVVTSAGQIVGASWFSAALAQYPWLLTLRSLIVTYAATLTLIAGVGLIFYFVPNARVRFRDVWVGAVLTGLLWRAAFAGFAWYVRDMSRFSVHGSIGAVVVFLIWIYISSVILLYGVEFTAAYSRLRRRKPDLAPTGD